MPEDFETQSSAVPEPGTPGSLPEHTPATLARLFVVPLLIVVMIVGCSAVVILLFGWISESRELSIEQLVQRIEQGASRFKAGEGEKILKVALLPEEKELWQAAKELAERVQADDAAELPVEQRPDIARRLGNILTDVRSTEQTEMGQTMQQFLLQTLGGLAQPESVIILIDYSLDNSQPVDVRRAAMTGLVMMRQVAEAQKNWPQLEPLIDSPDPVLRIVATVAIGALAQPGDELAIGTLYRASLSDDREVMWNATLALGRLGSDKATPGLAEMLSRDYWEDVKPAGGNESAERLDERVIEYYLSSAMDAAVEVGSPQLKSAVETLKEDPKSLKVKNHAMLTLDHWPGSTTPEAE